MLSTLSACEKKRNVVDVSLVGEGPNRSLPELAAPIPPDEIEGLATTFDWTETEALPEVDEDGRPALYYVMVLLRGREDLAELNLMDIHNDALPLFEVEHAAWADQTGMHSFPGSEEGDVAFALVPGEAYNIFRSAALDGDPIFDAVFLRDVPVAEAQLPGGSIDYDWMGSEGFVYGVTTAYAEPDSDDVGSRDDAIGSRTSPLVGRVFRAARRLVKRAVNGVRQVVAEVREGLGGTNEFSLRLFVHNTDPDFDTGPNELMRQGWMSPDAGRPIRVKGLEVLVASGTMISLNRGFTDENGFVRFDIPRARRIRVHIRLKNAAADLVGLFHDKRITVFNGQVDRDADIHLQADVTDADMNIIAQMTDARNFVQEAMSYESPRRIRAHLPVFTRTMPTALVRSGQISRVAPNAFAPCLGFYGFGTTSFGNGRGWSTVLANFWSIFQESDIWMPDDGSRIDRVTPTHEYGHYVMCAFLADASKRAFGRAWGEVWQDTLVNAESVEGEAATLAEAWADFFSSQVAGGYRYFRFGVTKNYESNNGAGYCRPEVDPTTLPCLEDNVGGTSLPFPQGQDIGVGWLGDPWLEEIARYASVFTDAVDGDGTDVHNGAAWNVTVATLPDGTNAVTDVSWQRGTHARDEDVVLPMGAYHDMFNDWALSSNRLTYSSLMNSLARTLWFNGATRDEICEMFALHSPTGMCTDMIDTLVAGITPSEPFPIVVRVDHTDPATPPTALLGWSDLSSLADGFEVTCESTVPGRHRSDRTVPYSRMASATFGGLPYDERLRFSVATTQEEERSEPAVVEAWTPPEPVGTLMGEGLPGAARVSWPALDAESVLVRMLVPEEREVGVVRVGEGLSILVSGLAGDVEYTFEAVSINGAGERSRFPTDPLRVRTLPSAELHVAPFGDDSDPLAGTAAAPYASLSAALAASADLDGPVTIRLATGAYAEPHQRIESRTVTVEGGYVVDGSTWTRGGTSSIAFAAGGDLRSVESGDFNRAGRRSRAGLLLDDAVFIGSDLMVNVQDASSTHCVSAVYSNASQVELTQVTVDATGTGPCRMGIESIGAAGAGRLTLRNSVVRGARTGTPASGSTFAGCASEALAEASFVDSEIYGIDDRGHGRGITRPSELFGWVDTGSAELRTNRSTFMASSTSATRDDRVDIARGADVSTSGWFASNTVFGAPGGADRSSALRVVGQADASVQLFQTTMFVGSNFYPSASTTRGQHAAVLSVEGSVAALVLLNNLFVFADWGSYDRYGAAIDLDGLSTTSTLVGARSNGNFFSYPPGSGSFAGGPLIMCDYQGVEFSTTADTEAEVNDPGPYLCKATGSMDASDNRLLNENPDGLGLAPNAVVLTQEGDIDTANTIAGTVSLLRNGGVPLASPIPVTEVDADRLGSMRVLANPGVGAFAL